MSAFFREFARWWRRVFGAPQTILPTPLSKAWVEEQRRIGLSKVEFHGVTWKWPVQ